MISRTNRSRKGDETSGLSSSGRKEEACSFLAVTRLVTAKEVVYLGISLGPVSFCLFAVLQEGCNL